MEPNIKYDSICIQGGGMKGIIYTGAIKALHEKNIIKDINICSGSSIGAIISLLIVLDYSPEEIIHLLKEPDLTKTIFPLDIKKMHQQLSFTDIFKMYRKYGLINTDNINKLIRDLIAKGINRIKEKQSGGRPYKVSTGTETFAELKYLTNKMFICTGSNLNKRKVFYFSCEHSPNMPVHLAATITCLIPLYFQPLLYNNDYYCDGGLIQNLPLNMTIRYGNNPLIMVLNSEPIVETCGDKNIFKIDKSHNGVPLGAPPRNKDDYAYHHNDIYNVFEYGFSIIHALFNSQIQPIIPETWCKNVIKYTTECDISMIDTQISEEIKEKYIDIGYKTTLSFINKHKRYHSSSS